MDQVTEHIWVLMARRLSGEASPQELEELETLLSQHPKESYSFEIIQDIWQNKPRADPGHSENSYKELILRMQRMGIGAENFSDENHFIVNTGRQPRKGIGKAVMFAGGIVIVIMLAFFFIPRRNTQIKNDNTVLSNNEIITKYGSKSNLVLPDGTKVYLNSGSKITYEKNYGADSREVNLSGEAYFDVIKNPAKPFIIHTNNINIRVLGTAFNVRCYPDEKITETSLIRGSLEVGINGQSEKIILKPGEKLIVSNNDQKEQKGPIIADKRQENSKNIIELSHVSLLASDSSIIETSWVNNRLVFRSESFEAVAHKMEMWYGIEITFNNEKLKTKKLTGIFENETITQALDALKLTTKFSYKFINDHIILSN